MKFTYKIDSYYPKESRAFVIYTPDPTEPGNEGLQAMGGWVPVHPTMTEDQLKEMIVKSAPVFKWMVPDCPVASSLVGKEFKAESARPTPENAQQFLSRPRVMMSQFRVALDTRGKLAGLEQRLKSLPDQAKKRKLSAQFEYDPWVDYTSDLADLAKQEMGLDDKGLLSFFREANAIR